jgi:hypothetical protein
MNERTEQPTRSRGDFIHFGVMFVGFVLAAAGMITNCIPSAVTGLILLGEGLLYFSLTGGES